MEEQELPAESPRKSTPSLARAGWILMFCLYLLPWLMPAQRLGEFPADEAALLIGVVVLLCLGQAGFTYSFFRDLGAGETRAPRGFSRRVVDVRSSPFFFLFLMLCNFVLVAASAAVWVLVLTSV